jgi:hypothetical protein
MIKYGYEVDLSEQQLLSCTNYGFTCEEGGNYGLASNHLMGTNPGSMEEEFMPYSESDDPNLCEEGTFQTLAKIEGRQYLCYDSPDNEAIKNALQEGTVIAAMNVYDDFFSYSGGVYERTSDINWGGHAVEIIGYDDNIPTSTGTGAWIAKNSWGTGWGEEGFFWIAYNDSDIGIYSMKIISPYFHLNVPPQITDGPNTEYTEIVEGEEITISLQATDEDWWDDELTYEWEIPPDCGELNPSDNEAVYVAPTVENQIQCEISVTVKDKTGAEDSGSISLSISPNYAPEISLTVTPLEGYAPLTVNFLIEAEDQNVNDTLVYSIDFGDKASCSSPACEHIYESPDVYTATITVTDNHGKSSETDINITVNENLKETDQNSNLQFALYNVTGGCGSLFHPWSNHTHFPFILLFLLIVLCLIKITVPNK